MRLETAHKRQILLPDLTIPATSCRSESQPESVHVAGTLTTGYESEGVVLPSFGGSLTWAASSMRFRIGHKTSSPAGLFPFSTLQRRLLLGHFRNRRKKVTCSWTRNFSFRNRGNRE
ncbi:hypothetical protein K443DRAFT_248889 [Laccaria amethystina LaAM-08-1]|uniref:Uncharacterized protein n=1 Tax=Laccaria amethystina LaAM-08-1 TaxID=1095629 RepID=A0A0C9XYG2_9AGAR|nr:hypothetical protein K443DRAFT_248889 [Laccaria amethystina LaAM-08-1]